MSIAKQIAPSVPELVSRLLEMSRDLNCPLRERLQATIHLLDRAAGKPLAPTEMSLAIGRSASILPANFDSLDQSARLAAIRAARATAIASVAPLAIDAGDEGDNHD